MFILISVGMCVVIMTGGIDLSVVALSSVTAALASPMGLVVAVPVGTATGLAVGLVNAGLIVTLRLPPFVATLAAMLGSSGLALTVSDNRAVSVDWTSDFTALGMNKVAGLLPWTILVAAVVVAFAWFLFARTSLGRTLLAVGGNAEAAHLMGLKTTRALVFTYAFSGTCAGLAGVFLASGYGAGQPLDGAGWELAAIAAVVVGGTLLSGGMGVHPGNGRGRAAVRSRVQPAELRERAGHHQPVGALAVGDPGRVPADRHPVAGAAGPRRQGLRGPCLPLTGWMGQDTTCTGGFGEITEWLRTTPACAAGNSPVCSQGMRELQISQVARNLTQAGSTCFPSRSQTLRPARGPVHAVALDVPGPGVAL